MAVDRLSLFSFLTSWHKCRLRTTEAVLLELRENLWRNLNTNLLPWKQRPRPTAFKDVTYNRVWGKTTTTPGKARCKRWPHLCMCYKPAPTDKRERTFSIAQEKCYQRIRWYDRLVSHSDSFQGRCATCLLRMYVCRSIESTVGAERSAEGFFPDGFGELLHPIHVNTARVPVCWAVFTPYAQYKVWMFS